MSRTSRIPTRKSITASSAVQDMLSLPPGGSRLCYYALRTLKLLTRKPTILFEDRSSELRFDH